MTADSSNTGSEMAEPDPESNTKRVSHYYDWHADFNDESEEGATPLGIAWSGIVIAAALYPTVLFGFHMVHFAITNGVGDLSPNPAAWLFSFLTINLMTGLIYGIIMTLPAYGLTQLLRWRLKGVISDRGMSGIFGGMTGFLCISGGGLYLVSLLNYFDIWDLLVYSSAMLLAVVMGYLGAILAGYRRRNEGFPFFEPIFLVKKQITISFLMKLTLIVAVLAVLFKATGIIGLYIGGLWLVYLLVQTLLLVVDNWIVLWLRKS